MKYGERVRAARLYAGFKTQGELVKKLGGRLTQQGLSHLEAGDAAGSELTVLIASVCGVSPLWLAEEVGDMIMYPQNYQKAIDIVQKLNAEQLVGWYQIGVMLSNKPAVDQDKFSDRRKPEDFSVTGKYRRLGEVDHVPSSIKKINKKRRKEDR